MHDDGVARNLSSQVNTAAAARWSGLLRVTGPTRSADLAFREGHLVEATFGAEHGLTAFRAALVLLASDAAERGPLAPTAGSATILAPAQVLEEASRCAAERAELGAFASLQLIPAPVDGVDQHADTPLEREAFDGLVETLLAVDGRHSLAAIIGDRPALGVVHDVAELAQRGLVAASVPTVAHVAVEPAPREPRAMGLVKRGALVSGLLVLSLGGAAFAMRMTRVDQPSTLDPARFSVSAAPPAAPVPLLAQPDSLLARTARAIPSQVLDIAPLRALLAPASEPVPVRVPLTQVLTDDDQGVVDLPEANVPVLRLEAAIGTEPVGVSTQAQDVGVPVENEELSPALAAQVGEAAAVSTRDVLLAVPLATVQQQSDFVAEEAAVPPTDEASATDDTAATDATDATDAAVDVAVPTDAAAGDAAPSAAATEAPAQTATAIPTQASPTRHTSSASHGNSTSAPPASTSVAVAAATPDPTAPVVQRPASDPGRVRLEPPAAATQLAQTPARQPIASNPVVQTTHADQPNPSSGQDHKSSGGDGGQSGKSGDSHGDGGIGKGAAGGAAASQKDAGKRHP
jgi:hypothetical protein